MKKLPLYLIALMVLSISWMKTCEAQNKKGMVVISGEPDQDHEHRHGHKHETKTVKKNFPNGKKIVFHIEKMTLNIEGYSGSEVVFETDDYHAPPERAKGLRPLYNSSADNTGSGLNVEIASGVMTVKTATHDHMHFHVKVPSSVAIHIEETGWHGDDFEVKGVKGEIEIMAKNSDIYIEGARGPIVANTTSGDITVLFEALDQKKPSSISNTSGFIDVTLPANSKANLIMNSISGEIYTDHNIQFPSDGKTDLKVISRRKIRGTINNGGVELALKTISDDIYLRKK